MHHEENGKTDRRALRVCLLTACAGLALAAAMRAAGAPEAIAVSDTRPSAVTVAGHPVAQQCLEHLRAFTAEIAKDGYWLGGSDYGYGYPMTGIAAPGGAAAPAGSRAGGASPGSYLHARPGYEVRTLIASANILANRGQEPACEALIATTREVYLAYARELHAGKMPLPDAAGWRRAQIAAAQPASNANALVNSGQLVGVEVVNAQGEALGAVDDMVFGSEGEQISYLVIRLGGLSGAPNTHVPVPWHDFKVTASARLLVLDTSKRDMAAAPQVAENLFALWGGSGQESQQVDEFWKTHLTK